MKITAILVKTIKGKSSPVEVKTMLMTSIDKFDKTLKEGLKANFLFKVIDTIEFEVALVPTNLYRRNGVWHHKQKYFNEPLTVSTPAEMLDLRLDSYIYSTGYIKFFVHFSVDNGTTLNIRGLERSDKEFGSEVWMDISDVFTLNTVRSTNVSGTKFEEASYSDYTHIASGIKVMAASNNVPLPGWIKGVEIKSQKEYFATGSSVCFLRPLFNEEAPRLAKVDSKGDDATITRLVNNVAKHIQYNHLEDMSWELSYVAELVPALLEARQRGKLDEALSLFFGEYIVEDRRIHREASKLVAHRASLQVPKNGEKFCGNREMKLRRIIDNAFMALGVTKLYAAITVPEEHLGSRISEGSLVPYIYTYNFFKDECLRLSANKHCLYMDLSHYFDSVTFEVVEKAIKYFSAGTLQEAFVNENVLPLIEIAMEEYNSLTIDSNYEHALSTVVMAYLFERARPSGVQFRTFVDDMLIFADSPADLDYFKIKLETILHEHGFSLNKDKELLIKDSSDLKSLVFLPTGLRYRIEDGTDVGELTELKKIGYFDFLQRNTKPILSAFSSVSQFNLNFKYEEAKWVLGSYDGVRKANDLFPPTDTTLLDYLQNATINMRALTLEEEANLMITMEMYPSKQKWIMSILKSLDINHTKNFASHPSSYVRYLATGEIDSDEPEEADSYFIHVLNDADLNSIHEVFTKMKYTALTPVLKSVDSTRRALSIKEDSLFVKYSTKDKLFSHVRPNDNPHVLSPYWLWVNK